ncbi:CrcB family protein [Clostridium autoethanogenum]|uniref:CrcB family protein n=1 Tax=Clostridium autoethanogenum TaxID=84023 RepID=UPI0016050F0D|nr:CrcB family protein [Clostridium autoethanogenum]
MNFLIVGIGGIIGSLARFCLGNLVNKKFKSLFPLGTFILNKTGALLFGIFRNSKFY